MEKNEKRRLTRIWRDFVDNYTASCCTRVISEIRATRFIREVDVFHQAWHWRKSNTVSRVPMIGDIWRERRNIALVSPVFIRPPFEGGRSLFRRGSTNIMRAPSWAFNGSTVCIQERRVSADTLSSRLAIASRFENQSPYRVSAPAFLRFVCRIASLRDRFRPDGAVADACEDRRRYSAGLPMWRMNWRDTRLRAFKENLSVANLTESNAFFTIRFFFLFRIYE